MNPKPRVIVQQTWEAVTSRHNQALPTWEVLIPEADMIPVDPGAEVVPAHQTIYFPILYKRPSSVTA